MTINQKIILIQQGYKLLKSQKGYSQAEVVGKLKHIGCETTSSTFNKIINSSPLGVNSITKIFQGFSELMKIELCLVYDKQNIWEELKDCKTKVIQIEIKNSDRRSFVIYPEGRLKISQKVDFFSDAEKEILEFGITLNTFSSYLLSRNPAEFKTPLLDLLKKGINIKCYLLDENWKGTSIYFEDRASVLKEGINGIEKIKASLRKLKIFNNELESLNYKGTFEVFRYRHFPNNYFLIIDKEQKNKTKMMVSNYLFAQHRASCPVMEFTRADEPTLFIRYADSFDKLVKDAKKVNFKEVPD